MGGQSQNTLNVKREESEREVVILFVMVNSVGRTVDYRRGGWTNALMTTTARSCDAHVEEEV